MQLKYKFMLAFIVLVTALTMILETISDQLGPESGIRSHSVFQTEQSSEYERTLYMYWPTYFGTARLSLLSKQTDQPSD